MQLRWIMWREDTPLPNNSSHTDPGWRPNPSGCHSNTEFPVMPRKSQHRLFPRPGCSSGCSCHTLGPFPLSPASSGNSHPPQNSINDFPESPPSALPRAVLKFSVTLPTERGNASTDQPCFTTVYSPKTSEVHWDTEIIYTLDLL